jgi:hypothetical protein
MGGPLLPHSRWAYNLLSSLPRTRRRADNTRVFQKGRFVAYLRFTPDEYRAIAALCKPLDLGNAPPTFVKRLLISSLAEPLPRLAERIARLSPDQLRLLMTHLHQPKAAARPHGLSDAEVELVVEAGALLMGQARFAHQLKRTLVRRLAEWQPTLAAKVERLSLQQFGLLCQQANDRARGDS